MSTSSDRLRGLDNGERAALIISECQSTIIDPEISMFKGLADAVVERDMLAKINQLASVCRDAGIPVIHCIVQLQANAQAFKANSPLHSIMKRNTLLQKQYPESNIHPGIDIAESDIISSRSHGVTSFHDTGLESTLLNLGVDTVILTGVSTNVALLGTCIEAINRGFAAVLPEDCTAGATPETHQHSIEQTLSVLATVTQSEQIISTINNQ